MKDIVSLKYRLKTRKYSTYKSLVKNVGDKSEGEEYPFKKGYELFSLGLSVGYANSDDGIKDQFSSIKEGDNTTSSEKSPYKGLVSFRELLERHQKHAYTIDLIHYIIYVEVSSSTDDLTEPDRNTWNMVVFLSDRGVSAINQELRSTSSIAVPDRIDEFDSFWSDKVQHLTDHTSQIPHQDEEGKIKAGN